VSSRFAARTLCLSLFIGSGLLVAAPQESTKKAPTADQARNNLSDRDLMQQIRKAVVDDKSLSTSAHNVKIIAKNGKVTLRGSVPSEDEKKAIEQKAAEVAGAGNVTNDLTIKAARAKKEKDKS
jgi:hyperosmotically inducible protein